MSENTHELDRIDLRILNLLQTAGRLSNLKLAEAVALSPTAVLARTQRLQREGYILGYEARLNPVPLGCGLELVRKLFGVTLGCNRDELAANISQHGLIAHARNLVGKSPDFTPTRRANGFSGGLRRCKTRQGVQPCLGFCALHAIPRNHWRDSK